jgi:hypothetical protein
MARKRPWRAVRYFDALLGGGPPRAMAFFALLRVNMPCLSRCAQGRACPSPNRSSFARSLCYSSCAGLDIVPAAAERRPVDRNGIHIRPKASVARELRRRGFRGLAKLANSHARELSPRRPELEIVFLRQAHTDDHTLCHRRHLARQIRSSCCTAFKAPSLRIDESSVFYHRSRRWRFGTWREHSLMSLHCPFVFHR